MKPLGLVQILLYSTANLGANMVYALANMGFPLFLSAYSVSNLLVGFLAQERSFVGGFVQPIVGAISDRLPPNRLGRRRPFFLIGVPLTALALILFSTHPPLWVVLGVMTIFSFFLAVANDPYQAMLPDMVPPEQRGRVGGVMASFNGLGQIAFIALAYLLWDGQQALVFWLVALVLIVSFTVTFFGVREPIPTAAPERAKMRIAVGPYLRDLLGRQEIIKYLVATFFFWMGNGGIAPFVTRFGVSVLGVEENVSFLLVLPAILGAAVFAVPAGLLTERIGKKRVLCIGMFLFGLAALAGSEIVRDVPQALVLMSIVGVANAITSALIFPVLADIMPRERAGEFTGIGQLVWSLAQPIGAMGAGAMADITGSLRGPFMVGGLAMLIGFVIVTRVRSERQLAIEQVQ